MTSSQEHDTAKGLQAQLNQLQILLQSLDEARDAFPSVLRSFAVQSDVTNGADYITQSRQAATNGLNALRVVKDRVIACQEILSKASISFNSDSKDVHLQLERTRSIPIKLSTRGVTRRPSRYQQVFETPRDATAVKQLLANMTAVGSALIASIYDGGDRDRPRHLSVEVGQTMRAWLSLKWYKFGDAMTPVVDHVFCYGIDEDKPVYGSSAYNVFQSLTYCLMSFIQSSSSVPAEKSNLEPVLALLQAYQDLFTAKCCSPSCGNLLNRLQIPTWRIFRVDENQNTFVDGQVTTARWDAFHETCWAFETSSDGE